MTDLDELLRDAPVAAPSFSGAEGRPRKCARRHQWVLDVCARCGIVRDEQRSRRGRQSRNYGNRAELQASRKYGGVKVGHAGGPVDIRGKDFATQVKTHRRLPPIEWTKAFAAMSQDNRCPRLLLRFVQGAGKPPLDYFVFPADDWLDWFGRDEGYIEDRDIARREGGKVAE